MPIIRLRFSAACAEAYDIAKTSNLHQKVGYRQNYKYRKLHADTPKTLTVVLSLVQTRKNQLSATSTYLISEINTS